MYSEKTLHRIVLKLIGVSIILLAGTLVYALFHPSYERTMAFEKEFGFRPTDIADCGERDELVRVRVQALHESHTDAVERVNLWEVNVRILSEQTEERSEYHPNTEVYLRHSASLLVAREEANITEDRWRSALVIAQEMGYPWHLSGCPPL